MCKECAGKQKKISPADKSKFIKENPRPKVDKIFKCPVCLKNSKPRSTRQVVLDHDHKTGKIRGRICIKCNVGIGRLREDIDILKRAIKWINKFK